MNRIASHTMGLLLALVLTIASFTLVLARTSQAVVLSTPLIIAAILALAMVQLAVQLIFFMDLGRGKDARWTTTSLFFTFFGILVVVLASIWIMNHLNYNMTPQQINQYITDQSGF